MRHQRISPPTILTFCFLFIVQFAIEAQTKKIKRPKSKVGISSVDNFVQTSFNLYDKVYKYDGYAATETPLEDEDLDVLEEALEEVRLLSESAPDILNDMDGAGMIKQGKATLQINRAKNALKYSIKTAKELLLGEKNKNPNTDTTTEIPEELDYEKDDSTINSENDITTIDEPNDVSSGLEVYSKYDFVPGDKTLFFDDFSQAFVGDLPSRWNTNGSGAIVNFNKVEGNWFELKTGYRLYIIPDLADLPENYSIEFDILSSGISKKTPAGARLFVILSDTDAFNDGKSHYASVSIPFGQNAPYAINTFNFFNGKSGSIKTSLAADIRDDVKNQSHIAISVTKKRYRLWINEVKYIDVPRFIEELDVLNFIKFHASGLRDGEDRIFIKNLKVAEGGVDLRRKLLTEGRVSTNGILFDSGASNIQPQSLGIVRQISQVLQRDQNIKLNIIGHTDADGSEDSNLKLSQARANAVKDALVSLYQISANRLTTDGKGETQPIGDNATVNGKSQNRRVEFVKL
ncbi:OmpA family protein [Winogradskyella bathintestinalis]|uniref:OmpA family protein n=1 Tax=Winogradskyella bathintestinalis TaxID=3035208 RepID=A0ABT7ZXR0_9FLAO|nr:OmpA family protein [Winogradskyella bathintestinalis]MDN3493805.1 OmpA family protein [Winogradskyella bathintestinalis]